MRYGGTENRHPSPGAKARGVPALLLAAAFAFSLPAPMLASISSNDGLVATAIDGSGCLPTPPGSLWSNGHCDGFGALTSVLYLPAGDYQSAADDFQVTAGCTAVADRLRVDMVATPLSAVPGEGLLRIFADTGAGHPDDPILIEQSLTAAQIEQVGQITSGGLLFTVFRFTFPLDPIVLPPGRYWLTPMVSQEPSPMPDWWVVATTGNTAVQLAESHLKTDPGGQFPAWTPVSSSSILLGAQSDLAFELDGSCAFFADGFESGDLGAWSATAP